MRVCFARLRNTTRYRGPLTDIVDPFFECIQAYIDSRDFEPSFYRLSLDGQKPADDPAAIERADVVAIISEAEFAWQTKGLKQPLHVDQSNERLAQIAPLFAGKPLVLLTFDRGDTPDLYRARTFKGIRLGEIGEVDEADAAFAPGLAGMKYWFIRERLGEPQPREIAFCYWGAANKQRLPSGQLSGDIRHHVLRKIRRALGPPPGSCFIGSFPYKDQPFTRDFMQIVPWALQSRFTLCFNWMNSPAFTSRYFEAVALGMVPLAWGSYGGDMVLPELKVHSVGGALERIEHRADFERAQRAVDQNLLRRLPKLADYKRLFAQRLDEEIAKVAKRKSIKTKQKTLGPRKKGAAMWNIDANAGQRMRKADPTPIPGGLTLGTMAKQYSGRGGDLPTGKRSRKANAMPSGGGGGKWKEMNEKMAASRARLQQTAKGVSPAGLTTGRIEMDGPPASGTSIFDPVLCELVYRWFCPPGGLVLDPFAGGSVRGIVASKLGRGYLGIDLRPEQVEANRAQAKMICNGGPQPQWVVGDALEIPSLKATKAIDADLVFSCPPYADLEVYSEDPRDLSTMAHNDFLRAYFQVIEAACMRLKQNRFACYVVGDARDAKGFYYGLPWRTVEAFRAAGLQLYNEGVLVTAAGSLPIRVRKQFEASRKFGKTHQNVLVFVKGDPVKATAAVGEVEFGDIELLAAGAPAPQSAIGGEV